MYLIQEQQCETTFEEVCSTTYSTVCDEVAPAPRVIEDTYGAPIAARLTSYGRRRRQAIDSYGAPLVSLTSQCSCLCPPASITCHACPSAECPFHECLPGDISPQCTRTDTPAPTPAPTPATNPAPTPAPAPAPPVAPATYLDSYSAPQAPVCRSVPSTACKQIPRESCRNVPRTTEALETTQQCSDVTTTSCTPTTSYVDEQVCHPEAEEVCEERVGAPVCNNVKDRQCKLVPKLSYVPRVQEVVNQECRERPVCEVQIREECRNVTTQHCKVVDKRVCREVTGDVEKPFCGPVTTLECREVGTAGHSSQPVTTSYNIINISNNISPPLTTMQVGNKVCEDMYETHEVCTSQEVPTDATVCNLVPRQVRPTLALSCWL